MRQRGYRKMVDLYLYICICMNIFVIFILHIWQLDSFNVHTIISFWFVQLYVPTSKIITEFENPHKLIENIGLIK